MAATPDKDPDDGDKLPDEPRRLPTRGGRFLDACTMVLTDPIIARIVWHLAWGVGTISGMFRPFTRADSALMLALTIIVAIDWVWSGWRGDDWPV